ncbi:MAG: winged helix-turn-helix domain-containing protein [Desulfamplus sp.]|nr:winged helix-turn-helix domain-containing protein [Desulfamplus sp.]MBF0388882.1 winged helix-turn-helix domain-containing protein [Desulfamplus sp.]
MNTQKYNLRDFDFAKIARKEVNSRVRIRLLVLANLKDGTEQVQIAKALKISAVYSLQGVYRLLHHLGFSWISSRSVHLKYDEKAQETYKKNFMKLVEENLPPKYQFKRC